MLFEAGAHLTHEVDYGLHEATVFLSQEAISSFLFLQGLTVTLPEELHIVTDILRIHRQYNIHECILYVYTGVKYEMKYCKSCYLNDGS